MARVGAIWLTGADWPRAALAAIRGHKDAAIRSAAWASTQPLRRHDGDADGGFLQHGSIVGSVADRHDMLPSQPADVGRLGFGLVSGRNPHGLHGQLAINFGLSSVSVGRQQVQFESIPQSEERPRDPVDQPAVDGQRAIDI
jgi:hypothetical protein